MQSEERLREAMRRILEDRRSRLALAAAKLQGVSPLEKLSQGYSFTESKDGKNIHDISQVKAGDEIRVYVKNGCIDAVVEGCNER